MLFKCSGHIASSAIIVLRTTVLRYACYHLGLSVTYMLQVLEGCRSNHVFIPALVGLVLALVNTTIVRNSLFSPTIKGSFFNTPVLRSGASEAQVLETPYVRPRVRRPN